MLDVLQMSKEDKVRLAQQLNDQRKELLSELGVAVDDDSPRAAAKKKIQRRQVPWAHPTGRTDPHPNPTTTRRVPPAKKKIGRRQLPWPTRPVAPSLTL
eukprot:326075-Prymnesium_polylepis.1